MGARTLIPALRERHRGSCYSYDFERVPSTARVWAEIGSIGRPNVFQTRAWVEHVAREHAAEPFLLRVMTDGQIVGHFIGLTIRRFGQEIVGSPFRGWGAYFMGFSLAEGQVRADLVPAFLDWVWRETRSVFVEIVDTGITAADVEGCRHTRVEALQWYAIDLARTEDELFAAMKSQCRNSIRKSVKVGVVVEEETDPVGFADEYYGQHLEVMERLQLKPFYSVDSLRRMFEALVVTGNILLLRSREPGGESIATGIFLFGGDSAVFWGAASRREFQSLRPNEPLAWHGIKAMKEREVRTFHFGGECDQYKEKFGTVDAGLVRITSARNAALARAFDLATSRQDAAYRNWILRHI
ncbi:MAG TPA: GNAT family N-acetyltransferase [Actinomycetaceae bacterium]|nr:GNAT family N-acetyltransferase [Actinomycetaceae bacterium]